MNDEKQVNAANPESVKEKAKKDRIRERQKKEDLRKVLEWPEGRRLLNRIMNEFCGLDDQFPALATESMQYSEGRRAVGLKLKKEIRREHPNALLLMLKEDIDAEIMNNG